MLSIALALLATVSQATPDNSELEGIWDAWLDSPGGKLQFVMNCAADSQCLRFAIWNGADRVVLPEAVRTENQLVLAWPLYDASIKCALDPTTFALDGVWSKRTGPERWSTLPFHATLIGPMSIAMGRVATPFAGRWRTQFSSSSTPAIAVFGGDGSRMYGCKSFPDFEATFLTTLGDFRFLTGHLGPSKQEFSLATFDGAHAFLFKAALQSDGSLKGDFWSGDAWHETWTAVRDENAQLPDPFGLTKWNATASLEGVKFPDLTGKSRALTAFSGKARMLVLFGTWCPNCNDEAAYLRELDERYRARGLAIVGLAFEHTGELERDAAQVKLFAAHHKLAIPLLIAGTSDKAAASKQFPWLDEVRAFPTTVFLHSDGRVRAVHQGYSGPATGAAHTKLREDFERLIEELLAEGEAGK